MPLNIHDDSVPIRFDSDGAVRVGPTRVTLEVVLSYYNQGATAEQIARDFDSLRLADVYSVLGYYLRNKAEVDAWLADRQVEADEIRQKIEAMPGHAEWRASMRARLEAARSAHVPASDR